MAPTQCLLGSIDQIRQQTQDKIAGSIPVESTRESPWWVCRPPCHHTYPACTVTGQSWDDRSQSSRKTKVVAELGTPLGQHSYHSAVMPCRVHDMCMQEPRNPNYIRVWHPHLHRRSPVRRAEASYPHSARVSC